MKVYRLLPACLILVSASAMAFARSGCCGGQVARLARIGGQVVELRDRVVAELGVGVGVDLRPVARLDVLPRPLPQRERARFLDQFGAAGLSTRRAAPPSC